MGCLVVCLFSCVLSGGVAYLGSVVFFCSTLLFFVLCPGVGCLGFHGFGSTLMFSCSVVVWVVLGSALSVLPF